MAKETKPPVYTVKRFGKQYWIEKDGSHYHGRIHPLMDISVPRYFDDPRDAWRWVDYVMEDIVDVPRPPIVSPTGMKVNIEGNVYDYVGNKMPTMTLDNAYDEPKPIREPNFLIP